MEYQCLEMNQELILIDKDTQDRTFTQLHKIAVTTLFQPPHQVEGKGSDTKRFVRIINQTF